MKLQYFWTRCRHLHGILAPRHPKTVQDLHWTVCVLFPTNGWSFRFPGGLIRQTPWLLHIEHCPISSLVNFTHEYLQQIWFTPTYSTIYERGFEKRTPHPWYNKIWDVLLVLNYLTTLDPVEKLTLKDLMLKLLMLHWWLYVNCAVWLHKIWLLSLSFFLYLCGEALLF